MEDYSKEIKAASDFFIQTKDARLDSFYDRMTTYYANLMHSQRWSMVYDFFDDVFPARMDLVTGFTYMIENKIKKGDN